MELYVYIYIYTYVALYRALTYRYMFLEVTQVQLGSIQWPCLGGADRVDQIPSR